LADNPSRVRSERNPFATNLTGRSGNVAAALPATAAVRFASTVDFCSSACTWRLSAAMSRRYAADAFFTVPTSRRISRRHKREISCFKSVPILAILVLTRNLLAFLFYRGDGLSGEQADFQRPCAGTRAIRPDLCRWVGMEMRVAGFCCGNSFSFRLLLPARGPNSVRHACEYDEGRISSLSPRRISAMFLPSRQRAAVDAEICCVAGAGRGFQSGSIENLHRPTLVVDQAAGLQDIRRV